MKPKTLSSLHGIRKHTLGSLILTLIVLVSGPFARGAGMLTPVDSSHQALRILDHHVDVRIIDGFARTVVQQTFSNPNDVDLEAIYAFPVPEHASLSEVRFESGETVLEGEVIPRDRAAEIYEEEKSAGREAGLASKESYQRFEFRFHPVRAGGEARVEFVYYQPMNIDTGVGRYVYPIEEGGTEDEAAQSFWTRNDKVDRSFSARVSLRSGYPIDGLRVNGLAGTARQIAEGEWEWVHQGGPGDLGKDLVVYYRLAENLPGRVDLLTHRKPGSADPGTFLLTVTPGIEFAPIQSGSDYVFILDTSGSMSGKIGTLQSGMNQVLDLLGPDDRYRLVRFSNRADALHRGWITADDSGKARGRTYVDALSTGGGTNIYAALKLGLKDLDADRPSQIILVTDGVTNQGIIEPARFHELMKASDVRIFGMLLGNSANWPLMRTICDAADGFYTSVSNADDLVGKILQVREKILYEALHDVELEIDGVRTSEVTKDFNGKIHRGQQLSVFGRYAGGGTADLTLRLKKTGQDETYRTRIEFPESDADYPELERLWALAQVESIELRKSIGEIVSEEAQEAIRDLGVDYQIVTDETSMLVLSKAAFERHGIERRNQARIEAEKTAAVRRQQTPPAAPRADANQPMFERSAPRIGGGGGGAFGLEALALLALAGTGAVFRFLRRNKMARQQ